MDKFEKLGIFFALIVLGFGMTLAGVIIWALIRVVLALT